MSSLEKYLLFTNFLLYILLAVFSYAYVDLNLTLSQNPIVLSFVQKMQNLGYYMRQTSTLLYLLFLITSFTFFIFNLWLLYKNKIGKKYLAVSVATNTFVLIFAYPFLSSDLFNYMFDAKIITAYQQSPYTHKPLDFPRDDWLRFMRWTHRYSPYGPLWLAASTIPSVLGFGKFLITLFLFKAFIGAFHLLNAYLILKILRKINPSHALFGTAVYALNPLFLIEGVANAHNDIVLAAFLISSIYFVALGKNIHSFAALALGTLVKYIPLLNLPWLFLKVTKGNIQIEKLVILNLATMGLFTYLFSSFRISVPFVSGGSTQVQFQPWYLFWTLPYFALIPKISLIALTIAISFGASLRYLPYLYYGDWIHPGTTSFMTFATLIPLAVCLLYILVTKKQIFK